jgi:hypothetical protein
MAQNSISKSELAKIYGISNACLKNFLNVRYIEQMLEIGYIKELIILQPIVIDKFIELYGAPLRPNELLNHLIKKHE